MAKRRTIHVLKNTSTNNQTLPSSGILMGEPLVNLYNGILFFSGSTGGNFVPSDNNASYFEVGSNLYNLELRNQITRYQNITGSGLVGKFLSGTTTGFVLSDISAIQGIDSYVTGATWSPNTLTLLLTEGKPNVTVNIDSFNSVSLYGTTNVNGNMTVTGSVSTIGNISVGGFVSSNLIPLTGCTYDLGSTTNRWNNLWVRKVNVGRCTTELEDDDTQFIITVSGTSSGATFNLNGGDLNVAGDLLPTVDLNYNLGDPLFRWNNLYVNNLVSSGLTLTNLTPGQVVYVGSSNELKTDSIGDFAFDDSTNTLTIGTTSGKLVVNNGISDGPSTFGQGGLVIGSGGSHSSAGVGDLIVHGNFTVFGTGTTVATNELYVEDPQITLNYNPTGNTSITSIASGIKIQDGDGVSGDTYLTIAQMDTFSGGDVTEYTGSAGYTNRAWLTQLNDIVIRNTNLNNGAPDGVRILAEFDVLDGGTY